MSSLLSKILETGMNVFKSNSQIMKNKNKNILKYQPCIQMRRKIDDDNWL